MACLKIVKYGAQVANHDIYYKDCGYGELLHTRLLLTYRYFPFFCGVFVSS